MAERRFLEHGGAAIQIEVATAGGAGGPTLGPKFVRAVQQLAELIGGQIAELDDKPDQVHVRFGMGVSADGNVLITRGTESANFEIRMQWGGDASSLVPSLPPQE